MLPEQGVLASRRDGISTGRAGLPNNVQDADPLTPPRNGRLRHDGSPMPSLDPRADDVLEFWFHGDESRMAWFRKDPAFDAEIRQRFLDLWMQAHDGGLEAWRAAPEPALAYIVVCDQFPRNMFRGEARAFATDAKALAAARDFVGRGWHAGLPGVRQLFVYLPFEHSEEIADQKRSLELFAGHSNYDYAVKHWEIIRRFGRFPHRNAALGRATTPEEAAFLDQPGSSF